MLSVSPAIPNSQGFESRRPTGRLAMGMTYAVATALTAVSVALGSSPNISGALGPASPIVLSCLGLAFLLVSLLGVVLGWRMLRLLGAQTSDAGARLHLRFVALFSLAAVAPAVIVALFFGVLVTRGVDSWFSARVQTVVENSATVARSYIDEQQDYIGGHVAAMAQALDQAAPTLGYAGRLQPLPEGPGQRQRILRRLPYRP